MEAYQDIQKSSMSDRGLEASVLTRAAHKLMDCRTNWDERNMTKLNKALKYNQMVWSIFQGDLVREDNQLPKNLKMSLLKLSAFIDQRIFEIMAYPSPDKLTIIVNINLNIAAGLRSKTQ